MPASLGRVSIVIPVYNGANYLREAIDSALAQTYPDVEILVINDGSRDGGATEAIARSYGDRIRYFAKQNGGVSSALNLGVREMTGQYFSWLSHDDVYLPHKVAIQMSHFVPGAPDVVLFGDYEFIDQAGRTLREKRYRERPATIRIQLVVDDPVNGCTVLVPRRALDRVGPFDERLRTIQDYDMWFRLARYFPFVHVPEIVLRSRLHPEQGIRTIHTHHAEVERELSRFIGELSPEEILASRVGGTLPAFYASLALRMKLRGFDEAALAALALARRHHAAAGALDRLRTAMTAVACAVLTRRMKPGYWLRRVRAARHGRGGAAW